MSGTGQDGWRLRCWQEWRAGNLTRSARDCLLILLTFRGPGGVAWPSHETLAGRVGCSVRTVQRALAQAQHLGLVQWSERRVRAGWRWLRTSNLYRLLCPHSPVEPGQRITRQHLPDKRPDEGKGRSKMLREMVVEAAALPDLLLLRRQVMVARWAARGGLQHA
jgi:DNA-binding transcriptional MocR family regulator